MTPHQEKKLDDLYNLVFSMSGDIREHKQKHEGLRDSVIMITRDIAELQRREDIHTADRNKLLGVAFVGGTVGTLAGIGSLILSMFKH